MENTERIPDVVATFGRSLPASCPGPQETRSSRVGPSLDGAATFGILSDSGVASDNKAPAMPSPDRYVASRFSGLPETFPQAGPYFTNALDLIDGSTVRPGTRLPVRKNNTTQTIGIKESYCPICKVILATSWARHHLTSRQHLFTAALESTEGGAL